MGILNYSTRVSEVQSVSQIEQALRHHDAVSITHEFDRGTLISVTFSVMTPQGLATIRLPSNPDAVLAVMQADMTIPRHFVNRPQAVRVSWRILKDWVEAQMAILESDMVKMEQIFLPYIITEGGKTIFEVFEGRRMLGNGRSQGA